MRSILNADGENTVNLMKIPSGHRIPKRPRNRRWLVTRKGASPPSRSSRLRLLTGHALLKKQQQELLKQKASLSKASAIGNDAPPVLESNPPSEILECEAGVSTSNESRRKPVTVGSGRLNKAEGVGRYWGTVARTPTECQEKSCSQNCGGQRSRASSAQLSDTLVSRSIEER